MPQGHEYAMTVINLGLPFQRGYLAIEGPCGMQSMELVPVLAGDSPDRLPAAVAAHPSGVSAGFAGCCCLLRGKVRCVVSPPG
jgi:hypothetical protein